LTGEKFDQTLQKSKRLFDGDFLSPRKENVLEINFSDGRPLTSKTEIHNNLKSSLVNRERMLSMSTLTNGGGYPNINENTINAEVKTNSDCSTTKSILFEKSKENYSKCFEINKKFFLKNNTSIMFRGVKNMFCGFK
jgi:hypothetical protein